MPGVEDWINRPLEIVQKIFDQQGSNCHDKVVDYFSKRLTETEAFKLVPSLNDFPPHQLKSNGLVRFRCMIQDMFDPEFYLGTYEVVDKHNNHRTLKCGLYKDIMDCKPIEEVDMNSARNITADRLSYYCVSVPGENSWVKEPLADDRTAVAIEIDTTTSDFYQIKAAAAAAANSCSSLADCNRLKRTLDSDGDNDVEMEDDEIESGHKKSCPEASSSNSRTGEIPGVTALQNMNFPIPNEGGMACLVKLYSSCSEHLKVTDVIEFVGILSVDPQLADIKNKSNCGEDEEMEIAAHNPPPSLVPRLHAIITRNFHHNVPYLPVDIKLNDSSGMEILSQAKKIREKLIKFLAEALLGDVLAAEYLLFHLISSVYFRQNVTVLGKFCLNLINFPLQQGYAKGLYNLLQQLVAKSHFLELSLENLNSKSFTPWKDYSSNRLISGILQLSPHTHLVVDETALSTGQLDSKGVKNVAALKHLIQWQNVEYDFKFHRISYPTNIGVLVLSEGKSILDSDCQVKLSTLLVPEDMKMHLLNLESRLDDSTLRKFQTYITLLKLANYDLNEEIKKVVQEDFVAMRKENPQMTGDDLHLLLVLGRFQSLSVGELTLTKESWEKVKTMEVERRKRLQPPPSSTQQ